MSETSQCRQCGGQIFWHKSKAGKPYPCDSDDRRDFHKCVPTETRSTPPSAPRPATSPAPRPLLEATPLERLHALELTVAGLVQQVRQLGARLPISSQDVAF
jgi:hypothetical protein